MAEVMDITLAPIELAEIDHVCKVFRVGDADYLQAFLVLRLAPRNPDLARKINHFGPAEMASLLYRLQRRRVGRRRVFSRHRAETYP